MKRYRILVSFLLLFLLSGLVYQTRADMGPKPTSTVQIIGMDEEYYFDLLYEISDYEFKVLNDDELLQQIEYDYYKDDFPDLLNGYRDSDGFASYTLYEGIPHSIKETEANTFLCGYFSPPSIFKVVIITESGKMFVSEIVNKTAFNASFTYDLSTVAVSDDQDLYLNAGAISEVAPFSIVNFILMLAILVIVTLVVELLILYAFGYRDKKVYIKVGIVNLITQIILQLLILYGFVYVWNVFGAFAFLVLGEIGVFITEIIAYRIILKERSKGRAFVYALVANLATFILGLISLGYLASIVS
ncbi:MAG: hypothetical protein JEZ05_03555 [Tenericutes bacterium]|nr:hypothetical protein [Mycoplasmatota bacterium]